MSYNLIGDKGGGGDSFKTVPDTLRSNDSFELLLGLGSGRWKGLSNGLKSLEVNNVPLENEDGTTNFQDFAVFFADGDPAQEQLVNFKLGGGGGTTLVNSQIGNTNSSGPGPWVSAAVTTPGADFIDLRFVISALYHQTDKGIFKETMSLELEMRPSGTSNWINPLIGGQPPGYNPNGYNGGGVKQGAVKVILAKSNWNSDGTAWANNTSYIALTDKTTSPAVKEVRIAVPNEGNYANKTWEVRVRLREKELYQADPVEDRRTIQFESIAAITKKVFGEAEEWRGLAWMQIVGKATSQLSGIPSIRGIYDTKMVKTPPPTVYNPITRAYTGTLWDGSYSINFTNDPAWCIKDLIEDPISGIAALSPGATLDKWDALEASKYYSQLVTDGKGGTHPRFSMNIKIDQFQKADELIQYLAGAVNSLAIDTGDGKWMMRVDKPETPVAIFTRDNIFGEFSYSHTDVDTRFNDYTVAFVNKEQKYVEDRVRVFDQDHIDTFGRKPTSIVAVGANTRQEALRRAMFRLRVSTREDKIVNFVTNRQGKLVQPLSIILVADTDLGYVGTPGASDNRTTTRLISKSGTTLTLGSKIRLEVGVTYQIALTVPNPQYNPEIVTQPTNPDWQKPTVTITRTVTNTTGQRGDVDTLYINSALPADTPENAPIALSAVGLPSLPIQYRVLEVKQVDEEQVAITALIIDTGKWEAADNVSEDEITSQVADTTVSPPTTPVFSMNYFTTEFQEKRVLNLSWMRPPSLFLEGFKIEHSLNDGSWTELTASTYRNDIEIQQPQNGEHSFRIYAIDRRGRMSVPLIAEYDVLETAADYAPRHLRGPLAGRPAAGLKEAEKYTTTDQNPNMTFMWNNGVWVEESNYVTQADQIQYTDGTVVEDLQPGEAGADVTGNNTSADTEAVAGIPSPVLVNEIQQGTASIANLQTGVTVIQNDITELFESVGSGVSAAEAADAAEAHRLAAELAESNAELAQSLSETARTAAQTAKTAAESALGSANTARDMAIAKATEAGGYATTSQTHRDAAAGSATSSAASAVVATSGAALTYPSTFNTPEFMRMASAAPMGLATVTGVGQVYEQAPGSVRYPYQTKAMPCVPGRRYRVRVVMRALNSNAINPSLIYLATFDSADEAANLNTQRTAIASLANPTAKLSYAPTVADGWVLFERDYIAVAGDKGFIRGFPQIRTDGAGSTTTIQVREISLEDVTDSGLAAGSATASAASASAASASQTAAGTSATAAQTARTAAETARGLAETARTEAATSATNAAGSASAASTSANTSASSATTAGQHATAAGTSATNAAASNTAAGQQAVAATDAKVAAETARGQAQSSASAAALSETNAAGSANTATTQAGLAATSRNEASGFATAAQTAAGTATTKASEAETSATVANTRKLEAEAARDAAAGSATAANTSASTASAKATEAGTSASAANQSKIDAQTAQGAASVSAGAAATSATNASGSATTATTQAGLAASSSTAALAQAEAMFPERMGVNGEYFSANSNPASAIPVGERFTLSGYGPVRRMSAENKLHVMKGASPVVAGKIWEVSADVVLKTAGGTPTATFIAYTYTDASVFVGSSTGPTTALSVVDQVVTITRRFQQTASGNISGLSAAAGGVLVRFGVFAQGGTSASLVEVRRVTLRDVTAVVASEASATAANTSAGTATTQAGLAGTSATAANTSKLDAQAASTTATTQAGLANASRVNADTAASTATTQATLAASWAEAAGAPGAFGTKSAKSHAEISGAQATVATGAAASATAQATLAANWAESAGAPGGVGTKSAKSHATVASDQATIATSQAAAATSSAVLAASVSINALNKNAQFIDYTSTTLPANWTFETVGTGFSRVTGQLSPYALKIIGAAGVNVFTGQVVGGISEKVIATDQTLVIEFDVELTEGNFSGAGFLFKTYDNTGAAMVPGYTYGFAQNAPVGELATTGVIGKRYRYSVLFKVTQANATYFSVHPIAHFANIGSIAAANALIFHRVGVRPATASEIQSNTAAANIVDLTASVATQSGAIVNLQTKTSAAYFQTVVNAGASGSFVQLTADGVVGSTVSIGAKEIHLYNDGADGWQRVVSIIGGDAVFTGGLQVGTYIRLGTGGGWPIALKPQTFLHKDGDTLPFGIDFGYIPDYTIDTNTLAPLAAGERYDVSLINLTGSGATVRLKIITPSAPSNYNLTTDTTPGTGPGRQIDKGANPDATNGQYTLAWTGSAQGFSQGYEGGEEVVCVGKVTLYVKIAGVWQTLQSVTHQEIEYSFGGKGTMFVPYSTNRTVTSPAGAQAFGISDTGTGLLTDFTSVSWQAAGSAGGTRTASPNNEQAAIRIIP